MIENDVIFGGEELLDTALEKAIDVYDPALIIVHGSVIPFLIGDDIHGISQIVGQRRGVKIISLTSPNYKGTQLDGYLDVIQHYITEVMEEPKEKKSKSVNLLGVFPAEYNWRNDEREIHRLLTALGLEINCVLTGQDTKVADIVSAPQAEANIFLYPEVGRPGAQLMQEKFGIPYIDTEFPPLGIESTKEWLFKIAAYFHLEKEAESLFDQEMTRLGEALSRLSMGQFNSLEWLFGKTYSLALSPFQIPAMVKFLYEDLSMRPITVAFREYNPSCYQSLEEVLKKYHLSPEIQTSGDIHEYITSLKQNYVYPFGDPWIAFGSTIDASHLCVSGIKLPVIRMAFPVLDEAIITDRPFMGLRGVITMAELIFNAISSKAFLTDQAFGNIPNPMNIAEDLARALS
jgi:nitrogenase molybdenum-iron protein alpha/beta subunit